jgi:hypothetical protein
MTVLLEFFIVQTTYLLAVSIGVMTDPPALGITPAIVERQGFDAGGLWTEHPQTALVAGAIYFAIVGLWERIVPAFVFRHDLELAALDRESGIVTA